MCQARSSSPRKIPEAAATPQAEVLASRSIGATLVSWNPLSPLKDLGLLVKKISTLVEDVM